MTSDLAADRSCCRPGLLATLCFCVFVIQDTSTDIDVGNYWPRVVASGAMLVASDAQSRERTLGSYMLSACNRTQDELIELAHLHSRSDFLLNLAMTYDEYTGEVLNRHILNTGVPSNVSEIRNMMYDENFVEMCNNLTKEERTKLTLKWAEDTATFVITIDAIRATYVIPSVMQVDQIKFLQISAILVSE